MIGWGEQTDIRAVTMTGDGTVTDLMVAAYLAKYATKGTEITGHASRRLTPATIELHADPAGTHVSAPHLRRWLVSRQGRRLSLYVAIVPRLGLLLRHWARVLGFGGHFLTKARRYSVTFRRSARHAPSSADSRPSPPTVPPNSVRDDVDTESVLVINGLSYDGSGWKTTGDALLANTAADLARSRQQTAREETSG